MCVRERDQPGICSSLQCRRRNLLFCQGEPGRSKCDVCDLPPGIMDCCEAVRFEVRRVRYLNEGGSCYS